MATTNNYVLTGIRLSWDRRHIEHLEVRWDYGHTISAVSAIWPRSAVISYIENGYRFTTFYLTSGGVWARGAEVHVVNVHGQKYLRTDGNRIAADNLENLREI